MAWDVWAEEIEEHKQNHCGCRHVTCVLGCGATMMATDLETHTTEVCDMRVLVCDCGLEVRALEMGLHQKTECEAQLR